MKDKKLRTILKILKKLKIPNYLYCKKCGATEGAIPNKKQKRCSHKIGVKLNPLGGEK